jgi:REP element-mobilizing transposase RayT
MPLSATIRSRGYLPHWESDHAVYFVTFRLADSLPQELIIQIRHEREILESSRNANTDVEADRVRLSKLRSFIRKAEQCLDAGLGHCYMRDPRIAAIVAGAIRHFQDRYRLLAWCVMPNHVHVLFSPLRGFTLSSILQSWKSYSAHQANRALQRSGVFWQREYFDHLVRSESHLQKFARYIEQNPQKAGLQNWPWVSCSAGVSPASSCAKTVNPYQSSPSRRPEAGATRNSS